MKKLAYIVIILSAFWGVACDDLNQFPSGSISGTVTDATTGLGLGDISITFEPIIAANGSVKSFHDGTFRIDRIVAGEYIVRVKKDGTTILDSFQDTVKVEDGSDNKFDYKLTPRISIKDFEVVYVPTDTITNFSVKFKGIGNQSNVFNYYTVMWDNYPNKTFAEVATTNKVSVKNTTLVSDILYEVKNVKLTKGSTYYIRVGASHLAAGGDYNLSQCIPIKFNK